jgi:DNA-binding NtrC family response regulator
MAKILTVDDDRIVLDFLKAALELQGHQVAGAGSTREALEYLDRHAVDLIITDIQMPGRSGLELIGEVSRRPSPPPVIAMSGGGHALSAQQCVAVAEEMGAINSITKPFSYSELCQAVDQGLSHADRRR